MGERRFTFFTYRERFRFFDVAVVREGCFFPFFFFSGGRSTVATAVAELYAVTLLCAVTVKPPPSLARLITRIAWHLLRSRRNGEARRVTILPVGSVSLESLRAVPRDDLAKSGRSCASAVADNNNSPNNNRETMPRKACRV